MTKPLIFSSSGRRRLLSKAAESVLAAALGLLSGALLMSLYGYDFVAAYQALFVGAFGDLSGILETLAFATPLILTAIAFAVGIRSGLFNIGAEGQMYIGAIAAVYVGGAFSLPPGIHLIAATLFAMIIAGLWSLPVAVLKITRGVHEVVSTIMLNWVAFWLVTYLITYQLADPARAERAVPVQETARYTVIGASLTTVFPVVIALAILVYFIIWRTTLGYELRVVGYNPEAARYAGISINKSIIMSFLIGGMMAGMAGASQVLGRPPHWTVFATMGNLMNLGFEGIGVSLIGRNHPIGIIFAGIFYGGLLHGGRFMEFHVGVASELVRAINGIIILALALPSLIQIFSKPLRRKREAVVG
ncbi:MAG: ABC transporter permease [Candidatus Caldarchaeum sp.]